MWDYTYSTIGAYQCEGEIVCPECHAQGKAGRGVSHSISLAGLYEMADPEGLYCGACGDELVAPLDDDSAELYAEDTP